MKISIIIPVYNVADYISSCLESVFRQSYNNYEVILVDDCGTDNSIDIARRIINEYAKNETASIIQHSSNKGLSAARNSGVEASTGEYLFFLDSDDQLPEHALMSFYDTVKKHKGVDFVVGNMGIIGDFNYTPLTPVMLNSTKSILNHYIGGKCYVMACGKLINRNFFVKNSLWFTPGRLHEDELFSFQLSIRANKAIIIKDVIYNYVIRNGSITTHKHLKNYIDILWSIEERYKLYKENPILFNSYAIQQYFQNRYLEFIFLVSNSVISKQEKNSLHVRVKKNIKLLNKKYFSVENYIKNLVINLPLFLIRILRILIQKK